MGPPLPLQPSKCVAIPFTRSHTAPDINLYIDGSRLTTAEETTYLGVVFDRKLSFRTHLQKVATKAEKRLNGLRRLCGSDLGISKDAAVQVYKTLTRSVIEYGAPAWVSRLNFVSDNTRLQILQNRCLRTALRAPYRTRIKTLHDIAGMLSIRERVMARCRSFLVRAKRHVYGVRHLVKQQYLEPAKHPGPTATLMPTTRRK